MALLRRLRLRAFGPEICFSQLPNSRPYQFTPPALHSAMMCLSRAFHRTPCGQSAHTPQLGIFPRTTYEICNFEEYIKEADGDVQLGLGEILERVPKAKDLASGDEAIAFLDESGVKPDEEFIFSVVWTLKEDWKLAYLAFKWGQKWDCVAEKTWGLMVWLLGNHNKFSTAWTLIHELHHSSKDTQQAMLIMIDRYAALNYSDKAIQTFHLMQKFKFYPDQKTYYTFLDILCLHGNIEEAEEFMFVNKKFFPLEVESFNIILNGWCNIAKDIYEAKRVWREMSNCCIEPDGGSYSHMISCYANEGNLFDSLRLYDQMKRRGWILGVEVYHSLIYVLTRENCLDEALKIVDKMKEAGLQPNSTTYNLIICPLCEAGKFEEGRTVLARMISENISPTVKTFHALILGENLEGTAGVLDHMKKAGLGPNRSTFVLILDRFVKLGQAEDALKKIWSEMDRYTIKPDQEHYGILLKGLVKNGLISEARKFYAEMKSAGISEDPSMKKLLEERGRARKEEEHMTVVRHIKKGKGLRYRKFKVSRSR